MSFRRSRLDEVAEVNPRMPRSDRPQLDSEVTFVPMAAVDEHYGAITAAETRAYKEVSRGYTPFRENDVLFAKITPCMENGKSAIARNLANGVGFGSTEFIVLRAGEHLLPEWLFYFVRQPAFRDAAKKNFTGSAGQQRVPADFIKSRIIPVPPLSEQSRIVDILSRAEGIVRLQDQAAEKTREVIPALFFQMFGDPLKNSMRWHQSKLGHATTMAGGATPSKQNLRFWDGAIPWVSPKDMKVTRIVDSQDHVSKLALEKTNLRAIPKDSILVVVRGMILAHTVPIARTATEVTINQDMKALIPNESLNTNYLLWLLKAMHAHLLGKVSVSAHGTRKLDTSHLTDLMIPIPPIPLQQEFADRAQQIESVQQSRTSGKQAASQLLDSLMSRAFSDSL